MMKSSSSGGESRLPWDPIWEYITTSDRDIKVQKQNNNVPSSRAKQIRSQQQKPEFTDETRDGILSKRGEVNQSSERQSNSNQFNLETRDPDLNTSWHWELDTSYFQNSYDEDAGGSLPSHNSEKRKVRFSPFKQVTMVEENSITEQSSTDLSHSSAARNDTVDSEDIVRAFSLTEFLENWNDYLEPDDLTQESSWNEQGTIRSEYDDATYESSLNTHSLLTSASGTQTFDDDTISKTSTMEEIIHLRLDAPQKDGSSNNNLMEPKPSKMRGITNESKRTTDVFSLNNNKHDTVNVGDGLVAHFVTSHSYKDNVKSKVCEEFPTEESVASIGKTSTVCCTVRDFRRLPDAPLQKMTAQEKYRLFPQKYSVSDDELTKSSKNSNTMSTANSNELSINNKSTAGPSGPQSLYEYDYENGKHRFLSYTEVGLEPKKLVVVETPNTPSIPKSKVANHVLVIVEASSISHTDGLIRQGHWLSPSTMEFPKTPGVDFVGRVCQIDPYLSERCGLVIGDRVMSLCTTGGNTRYIAIDYRKLVHVPTTVDPSIATCIPETYLAAFQALHYGQNNAPRYKPSSLKGRSILVLGSMTSNLGRAVAELGVLGNPRAIFGTAKQKHFQLLESMGLIPLDQDSMDWWIQLHGKLDLIISLDQAVDTNYANLLTRHGEIVVICVRPIAAWNQTDAKPTTKICSRKKAQISCRTFWYDVHQQWRENLDRCKKDIAYLLRALENDDIHPYVLDRIPLSKVGKVHEFIASKRLSGFVVCEPWLAKKTRALQL